MALPIDSPNTPEEVRKPRQVRLLRWLFLIVGAIAILIAAGWWTQRPLARIPLPDGGELLLIDAQYGPEYRSVPHMGLGEQLQHFFSSKRGSPVPPPRIMQVGDPADPPRLWLLFHRRGPEMENPSFATMESGQTLENPKFHTVHGAGFPSPLLLGEFKCYPRRARRFDVRISVDNGRQNITTTIPNPFPVSNTPRWTPEPVPQTRRLKTREIVLESLGTNPRNRNIQPVIKVHETGVSPDAFKIEHMLSDATGNSNWQHLPWSEPAWKIHVSVTPNWQYPFPASEYLSLGHTTMPGPGEYRLLTLPADPRVAATGGHALFTGPGWYRIHFGTEPTVESVQPLAQGAAALSADGSQTFVSEPNQVLILGQGTYRKDSPDCRHLMRAVVGTAHIPFNGQGWGLDYNRIPREDFQLSAADAPTAGTEMEIQLLLPSEDSVDFFVRPPQ